MSAETAPRSEPALHIAMIGSRGLPNVDGGVEHAVEALSRELVSLGQQVTVYGRLPYCANELSEQYGVRQVPLPCLTTKHLEALTHSAIATSHALASRSFDLIHFHAAGPSLLSVLPSVARKPSVATLHALDYERDKWGRVASAVLRAGTWAAAHVPTETIAVSRALTDHVRLSYGRSAHYIPNGVDLPDGTSEQAVPELEGRRFALFVGRLVPEKGVHTLIRAFQQSELDADLAIVGDASHTADYADDLRTLAASDSRIKFLGRRVGGEKLWLLLKAAVFVQPSTLEGMPIALLEAIACQSPVVVSNIPAHQEAIAASPAEAWVFEARNEAALRAALERSFSRTPRLRPASQASIPRDWDWRQIAQKTLAVYRTAMARRDAHIT